MLHQLQMSPFKVLTILLWIQNSMQLSLLALSSLLHPCFFWRYHTYQHCVLHFGFLQPVHLWLSDDSSNDRLLESFQLCLAPPPFSLNLFQLASLLASLVGLNLSSLIGALAWFFTITKIAPFEFVEEFRNDPFLAVYFFLFINDLPASLPSSVSCSLYAEDLAFWSYAPAAVEATKKSNLTGALV